MRNFNLAFSNVQEEQCGVYYNRNSCQ